MGDYRQSDQPQAAPALAAEPQSAPEALIAQVAAARAQGEEVLRETLQSMPVAIYLTDREGWLTHHTAACTAFFGRIPQPGEDRWSPAWRLYREDGTYLPPEECALAEALRQNAPVRGVVTIAEHEDGSRVMFLPYPTPLRDGDGAVAGAINLLIDITDQFQADALRAQAARCRRLAGSVTDRRTIDTLAEMAAEYEEKASSLKPDDEIR